LLFVGLAVFGMSYQAWDAVRMMRDRAADPDRLSNRDHGRPRGGSCRLLAWADGPAC
jgi:hypothetical protein